MNNSISASDLARAKELQLCILQHIDKFCKENQIAYQISYGTLLGAIRHQGFIPWDDDIDICMPRADYERFLATYKNSADSPFALTHFGINPKHIYAFAKLGLKHTKFVSSNANLADENNLYIDIFPFDAVSKNPLIARLTLWRSRVVTQLFTSRMSDKIFSDSTTFKGKFLLAIRKILHRLVQPISPTWLFKQIASPVKTHNSYYVGYLPEVRFSQLYPHSEVFPSRLYTFEHLSFPGAHDAHKVLTRQYGQYMELPPENQRYGHKPLVLDLGPWLTENPQY